MASNLKGIKKPSLSKKGFAEDERLALSLLKNILECSIEYAIIALDLDGKVLLWGQGAQRIYGYTAEEARGKKVYNLLKQEKNSKNTEGFKACLKRALDGSIIDVYPQVRKNGAIFTADICLSTYRNDKNEPMGFLIIAKDITESKKIEERLLKNNEELEEFAYIVSHDLKAPLRAIDRLATWIYEDCEQTLDEKSKEHLNLLCQRVKRMSSLIDGILEYSRAGRMNLEESYVKTRELIQESIDLLDPNKEFEVTYKGKFPNFHTAKVPLAQVFSNLISNAIKYNTSDKGKIVIGVKDINNHYEFSVKDNGPGIEKKYRDKIFQIFQTLQSKDNFESTGIGLSIVKKIVESQGGEITVKSIKNRGSTFIFTWPKKNVV